MAKITLLLPNGVSDSPNLVFLVIIVIDVGDQTLDENWRKCRDALSTYSTCHAANNAYLGTMYTASSGEGQDNLPGCLNAIFFIALGLSRLAD